jgi:hypothetical protein
MRRLLVRVERGPVAVQLVEDPLPGLTVHMVAGVHECARLAGPDARGRLGHQLVEQRSAQRTSAAISAPLSPARQA